jgi:hypothetical protein
VDALVFSWSSTVIGARITHFFPAALGVAIVGAAVPASSVIGDYDGEWFTFKIFKLSSITLVVVRRAPLQPRE